jgi:hypothetical protein
MYLRFIVLFVKKFFKSFSRKVNYSSDYSTSCHLITSALRYGAIVMKKEIVRVFGRKLSWQRAERSHFKKHHQSRSAIKIRTESRPNVNEISYRSVRIKICGHILIKSSRTEFWSPTDSLM